MKISTLFLSLLLALPVTSYACSRDGGAELQKNLRFYPIVGGGTNHWSPQQTLVIGSIASFLVPTGTTVELRHIKRGLTDPLTVLGEASHDQIRVSRNIVPQWVDLDHDPKKYKWVHIYASSFGTTAVNFKAPDGWQKSLTFSNVYASPLDKPFRQPKAVALGQGEVPEAMVDARDNIDVRIPGNVSDGWTVSPPSATGFELIRIQQIEKIDGEPEVRLFFAGTSGPKNATMTIQRGTGNSSKTFEFKIKAIPTAAC